MKTLARVAFVLVLVVPVALLAACTTSEPREEFPELTFTHLGPIELNVASTEIVNRYVPPMKAPNVEHRAPTPPYVALRRWGEVRLKATGGSINRARFVVADASITETPLPTTGGIRGVFTREQGTRYEGRMDVRLEIVGPGGGELAFVRARSERTSTVREGASIAERERLWFKMTEEMIQELDSVLEENIRQHLGGHLYRGS